MTNPTLLAEIDELVRTTYALWQPGWVTFNWREYTYDHVQRVRCLAIALAAREAAAADVVELAAQLHDITKPYDGEYVADAAGQRIVDTAGQWHNHLRPPQGRNEVTTLYDELALAGTLHNISGARVAHELLARRGVPRPLCAQVATAIEDHLAPLSGASGESLCLYDADTIDANIGLPAFVRNIYIHLHFYEERDPDGRPLDSILEHAPLEYLGPYVRERLKPWAEGKRRDFVPRLRTAAGRALAIGRLDRLDLFFDALGRELSAPEANLACGMLAVLLHYMRHREQPSIADETRRLASTWSNDVTVNQEARALVSAIVRESQGQE